jgi:pSer/pThr/pTyr-binding forkhead associated (FHA) protein
VNNQRIHETTTLRPGMTIRIGKLNVFKFMDPNFEEVRNEGCKKFYALITNKK